MSLKGRIDRRSEPRLATGGAEESRVPNRVQSRRNIRTTTRLSALQRCLKKLEQKFFVDIDEPNNADRFLSLDALKFRVGTSGSPANFTQSAAGDLVYDLDQGPNGNVTVLLDANFFAGSGLGYDLKFLIPDAAFAGRSSTDFVTLFATFGATTGFAANFEANGGFEEIAAFKCTPTGTCAPPPRCTVNCSPPPNEIPEPGTLALLGLALLGAVSARRRKQ